MSAVASPTALICGISGQDGSCLAQLLLSRGYLAIGTARDAQMSSFANLDRLGIRSQVQVVAIAINDFRSVLQVLSCHQPAAIYRLAGQSSVGLTFEQPVATLERTSIGTLNLLESIRLLDKGIRLYNASSGECFGDTGDARANEETPFRPRSPYAVAKAAAFWQVANYREAYGLFACSGILFNHESPLRPERFVTQKVVRAACRIAADSGERQQLDNMDIQARLGAGLLNVWTPCGACCSKALRKTSSSPPAKPAPCRTSWPKRFLRRAFSGGMMSQPTQPLFALQTCASAERTLRWLQRC